MYLSNYPAMSNDDLAYFDSPDPTSEPLPICLQCEEEVEEWHQTKPLFGHVFHASCAADFEAEMEGL
jgi:hypothetical protein